MYESAPGATGQSYQIFLRDSLSGQAKVGLTAGSSGARGGYVRQGGSGVNFVLSAIGPTDPWYEGGFAEIDPVLNKGMYRVDVPDAAHAAGAGFFSITLNFDGTLDEGVLVLLRQAANLVGPGANSYSVTLQNAALAPVAGAGVWVSTDPGGSNVIAGSLVTSTAGGVTFLLNDGSYYLWVNASGYAPQNPYAFVVSGSGGNTITLAPASAPAPAGAPSVHEPRVTAFDLVQRLMDFAGADPDGKNVRAVRTAVLDAVREFATLHNWTYLRTFGRVELQAAFATGTIEYDEAGGTYDRMVTLAGGTWPSWSAYAYLRAGGIVAKVAQRVSDTVLTLKDPVFVGDIAAGTGFTLYRDTYTLPSDYVHSDNALAETSWGRLSYVRQAEWLSLARYQESSGRPAYWTVAGDPDVPARLAIRLYPTPDANTTLDFTYQRKPRPITVFDLTTGTASCSLADPTLVTFERPVLRPAMAGSVLRLADALGEAPDGPSGLSPYTHEGNIVTVLSPTSCRIDAPVAEDLIVVAYRVSDPVDAEDLNQLVIGRGSEKAFALSRLLKGRADVHAAWVDAVHLAKEGDSRVSARQAEGRNIGPLGARLRERGPIDFSN